MENLIKNLSEEIMLTNNSAENTSTNGSDMEEEFPRWLVFEGVLFIITIFTIWLLCSLIHYGKKTGKWKMSKKNPSFISMLLAVLAVALNLPHLILTEIETVLEIYYEAEEDILDDFCERMIDTAIFTIYLSIVAVYTFVWYRQHILYQQPLMKHLNTKFIRIMSFLSITVIYVGGLYTVLSTVTAKNYQKLDYGCSFIPSVEKEKRTGVILGACMTVSSQLIIFFLVVYPLIINKLKIERFRTNDSTSKDSTNTEKQILKTIKTLTISLMMCVTSDVLIVLIISFLVPKKSPRSFGHTLYAVGFFINTLSIIIAFDDRSEIVFGLCAG